MIEGRWVLVSDVDDTLLGDDEAMERFNRFYTAWEDQLALVYASGRFWETLYEDIESGPLPEPVAIIGGVGSEIRHFPTGDVLEPWIERMNSVGWSAERAREILREEPDVAMQPQSSQSDFKVSCYLNDAPPQRLQQLQEKLRQAGIASSNVYSSGRDLDFLPEGVDKGSAARFLVEHLQFSPETVIVAGDSGNDVKLFQQGFYGIVVANAHPELRSECRHQRHYLSPFSRADGVRDGLEYWIRELS